MSYLPPPNPPPTPYQPTPEQLARAAALKRYNRRFYLWPIAALVLFVFLLGLGLLIAAFAPAQLATSRIVISAVADITVVVAAIMLTPLCLVLPTGAIALYFYDQEREMTRVEQLQRFLWRVDGKMAQGRQYTAVYTARLARPFITIHSFIAGVRQLLYRLRYYLFNK
jgi:hypothetical protein